MASYMVNPSKKISELLSQFLEFDPKQLQVGIWSGDLSITDVHLKREAFAPLLNPTPHNASNEPLHLKLVSGKVGHMRVQIPWKRLVWGQGDVRLDISDVDIVLAYESREATQRRLKFLRKLESKSADEDDDDETGPKEISEEERERKQAWLLEAEKRQLQGLPIPTSFEDCVKQDKEEETEAGDCREKEAVRIESYLEQATKSLVWRFFAGLQASIRNIRVVIVQDGVEIGVIQHSMEIKAGKQAEATVATEPTGTDFSDFNNTDSTPSEDPGSVITPPNDMNEYKGEYEDGEHVDKTIEVEGFGVFIRKVSPPTVSPLPQLSFSHAVDPDDYVLRPTKSTLSLSFFYPYPPDKQRKKKKKKEKAMEVAPPIKPSANVSIATTETTKARRGKREKAMAETEVSAKDTATKRIKMDRDPLRGSSSTFGEVSQSAIAQGSIATSAQSSFHHPKHSSLHNAQIPPPHWKTNSLLPPMTELFECRSVGTMPAFRPGFTNEARSVMDGTRATPSIQENASEYSSSPELELQLTFGALKTVFSSRHYHYSMTFFSTLTRMRSGRPGKSIKSHLGDEAPEPIRSVIVDSPLTNEAIETPNIPRPQRSKRAYTVGAPFRTSATSSTPPSTPKARPISVLPPPPPLTAPGPMRHTSAPYYTRPLELKLLNFAPVVRSEKEIIVKSWWIYAYKNVLREVRERRKKRCNFSFKFEWEEQKRRRQEYINLYLRRSVEFVALANRRRNDEETMRKIEDELPVEQILLYRSIARALHVRGMHEMGDSILCLQKDVRLFQKPVSLFSSKTKESEVEAKRDLFGRRTFLSQSTGDLAVDTSMRATSTRNSTESVSGPKTIEELQHMCREAKNRREDRTSFGERRSTNAKFAADKDRNPNRQFRGVGLVSTPEHERKKTVGFPSAPRSRAAGSVATPNAPAAFGRHSDMTIGLSKSGGSHARTRKTSVSSTKKDKKITEVCLKTSDQLRFSFNFKLERLELLVWKDEAFVRSLESEQMSEMSALDTSESQVQKSQNDDSIDDDSSSDDISYLTEDGAFTDADDFDQKIVEEIDNEPILSSTDFFAFGTPTGVILDVCITPLNIFCGGLSGGSRKVAFSVGAISVLGEDKCQLLTAGSMNSQGFRESFTMQEINLELRRKSARGRLLSRGSDTDALEACFLFMENGENFLEADVAKIVISAEMDALVAVGGFAEGTSVAFPRPLIEETELDTIRDLLTPSQGSHVLGSLDRVDCALRCHGVDVFVPCSSLSSEDLFQQSESQTTNTRKKLKASVKLIECYSGKLVEHIRLAASEQQDESSRFSGAKSTGFVTAVPLQVEDNPLKDQGLKLLDVCQLFDQQRRSDNSHAIISISGIHLSIEDPSLAVYGAVESISFQRDPVDVEVFLTSQKDKGVVGGHAELTVGVSPLMLLISQNRLSVLSEIFADLLVHQSAPVASSVGDTYQYFDPPRLEALSKRILFSLSLSIATIGATLVSDSDDEDALSPPEQEIVMEESISDYLSFVACFDLQHPVDESIRVARQTCIERLVGIGFEAQTALDCAELARRQFLEDIELVRNAEVQTYQMATSQREENTTMLATDLDDPKEVLPIDEGSILDETDSTLEENSQESLDILETALQNAMEQTVSAFLPLIGNQSDSVGTIAVFEASKGLYVRATKLFYDSYVAADIPSLTIRNASGVGIMSLGSKGVESDHNPDDSHYHTDQVISGPSDALCDHGLRLTVFELDKGFDFAKGGSPRSVLGSDDHETVVVRHRTRLVDAKLGTLNVYVCSKILVDLMDSLGEFPSVFEPSAETLPSVPRKIPEPRETSICTNIEELSVFLMSDELNPFTSLKLKYLQCTYESELEIEASDLLLLNLTPEGQYFPRVIQPLKPDDSTETWDTPVIRLKFSASPLPWKTSSTLLAKINGVQILLLRQYIEELSQFHLAEDHGIGRLLSLIKTEPLVDENGNKSPPLMLRVLVSDSSLVLPRTSISTDMVAFEFSLIDIFNSYHEESFRLADATRTLEKGEARSFTTDITEEHEGPRTQGIEFYDCVETTGGTGTISSFQNDLVLRFNVLVEDANIFTTLPSDRAKSAFVEGAKFLREHRINGRASDQKSVFETFSRDHDVKGPHSRPERVWECITSKAASLEILMDYAPQFRVLITDDISNAETTSSLDIKARMSQFYLLLSVWYGNMQELPVLFPRSEEVIKKRVTYLKPPPCFPEYGTHDYVQWLLNTPATFLSEIACHFVSISMHCAFDPVGYFDVDPSCLNFLPGDGSSETAFSLSLKECIVHSTSDEYGIMRVGCSARSFAIEDQRKGSPFNEFIGLEGTSGCLGGLESPGDAPCNIWADLDFGLDLDGCALANGALALPFQATVFMTPGWTLVNIGAEGLDAVMVDLTPIWMLLDYYSSYFSSEAFGHPYFEAVASKEKLKRKLETCANDSRTTPTPGSNIDFRLWLFHPFICIPSDINKLDSPSLRIKSDGGFWYQYKSLGSYASQEMGSPDLSLHFSNEFQRPDVCRDGLSMRNSNIHNRAKRLIDGLSFGFRMDFNEETNHSDYAFCMPMWRNLLDRPSDRCRVTSSELEVLPIRLPPPTVCSPTVTIDRELGTSFCEVTVIVEVLPQTSSMLLNFLGFGDGNNDDAATAEMEEGGDGELTAKPDPSYAISARVESLRFFVIDPTLGVHLPLAVFSLSTLKVMGSRLGTSIYNQILSRRDSPLSDLQLIVETTFWADYFKLGITRSWEPLIEPFKCLVLYEKSLRRGEGLTLTADNPFHVNVTGALLLTLEDAIASLSRAVSETFGYESKPETQGASARNRNAKQDSGLVQQEIDSGNQKIEVQHQIPEPLNPKERIAFSLLNLTGHRIRINQLLQRSESEKETTSFVTYLKHLETTRLDFQATVSMVQNLRLVEVPFPGLPHSERDMGIEVSVSHSVDVQLPGFKWLKGISVDTSGRKFDDIIPRSPIVQSKISKDWRLANTMKLLTEVGLDHGGRLITVRSLFEIRNHTTHSISLCLHPDPMHKPSGPVSTHTLPSPSSDSVDTLPHEKEPGLSPGDALQVPSLLLESALRLDGNHLGCMWVRPEKDDGNEVFFKSLNLEKSLGVEDPTVGFSSRPVQLAKIVHESALLFQGGNGEDLPPDKVRSGIQISCPIADGGDGVPVAPFCYAIEIRRSPIVRDQREIEPIPEKKVSFGRLNPQMTPGETKKERKTRESMMTHRPVAYTLMVHPPIVIENLLPAHGRFELMHATRRSVLWFSDLKPGEKVSVHTVGLDAPLLLLVNLGFCKTPVGEGALVHHGSDVKGAMHVQQGGLKSIGKAVTMGTKQIGKTLTSMSDSPDRRGKGKVFLLQNPQYHRGVSKRPKNDVNMAAAIAGSLGLDTDIAGTDANSGHVHLVDGRIYNADEIATETVVVDGVGQKLTLKIENVRGGGGQRRISLFCPFWIVNTTEHSLRYKQEKSSNYVSGTVMSPWCDGSRTVDGSAHNIMERPSGRSRRSARNLRNSVQVDTSPCSINQDTVFSGTSGALARVPVRPSGSRERLAKLLEKELPLEDLASIAFMFNFHEETLLIGHQRLVVQLADGTGQSPYTSDWSQGFSLDSIGVPQLVGMHCKDRRVLELSVTISVAPGFLSGYTKIIRFTPRYILVNRLSQPIRIWQDSSLLHSVLEDRATQSTTRKDVPNWHFRTQSEQRLDKENKYEILFGRPAVVEETILEGAPLGTTAHKLALYIATVGQDELVPFHLPDTRGDRQFRIDLGGSWNLSPSFDADVTGEHTLRVRKALDLRLLRHVNTRASPHYKVAFPPEDGSDWAGELGVWFETSWGGDRKILVKGTKRGRHAFNNTDIRVGDELLQVDDTSVSQLTFAETMKLLKERLAFVAMNRRSEALYLAQRARSSLRQWKQKRSSRAEEFNDLESSSDLGGEEQPRVVLTFRTLEERLRRVRIKASRTRHIRNYRSNAGVDGDSLVNQFDSGESLRGEEREESVHSDLKVEMRAIHNSIFVVVREQSSLNPPYRVENRAINHFIFFRQRGCVNYPWNILQPGESTVYCWEEPMKPHKLTVRVGAVDVHLHGKESPYKFAILQDEDAYGEADVGEKRAARNARLKQSLSFHNIDGEDQAGFGAMTTVKIEEIGFECELPCPRKESQDDSEKALNCHVDSNGATRLLVISNNKDDREDKRVLQHHISALRGCVHKEEQRVTSLQNLTSEIVQNGRSCNLTEKKSERGLDSRENPEPSHARVSAVGSDSFLSRVENEATSLADFPEDCTIWRCHQIVIEVLEAAGLSTSDVTVKCNPYCEIALKGSKRRKSLFSSSTEIRKTYFMEGTSSPKWIGQTFIFDVPRAAAEYTREHTLQVRVRGFRFIGQHPYLGQTNVHLRSLRNQRELVGWYPLVGRTGPRDLEDSQANWGRGSLKLRVQWIYTVPALVNYFLMLSENRLCDLQRSLDGMKGQLNNLLENEASRNRLKKHEITEEILKDPFGVATRLLLKRNPQSRRRRPSQVQQNITKRQKKGKSAWPLVEPMKISRDRLLWLFHFQTEESRRARKASWSSEQDDPVPISIEMGKTAPIAPGERQYAEDRKGGREAQMRSGFASPSLMSLDENSTPAFRGEHGADSMLTFPASEKLPSTSWHQPRQRSLSVEDIRRSMDVLELTKKAGPFVRSDAAALEEFGQLSAFRVDGTGSIIPSTIKNEVERLLLVDELLKKGLVYHAGGSFFLRNHLAYYVRFALIEGVVHTDMRPKSPQRLSLSDVRFKTWLVAAAVFNDSALKTGVSANKVEISLTTLKSKRQVTMRETPTHSGDVAQICRSLVMEKIGLPNNAPTEIRKRLERRAEGVYGARTSFERACKRSLRAVLNPGGWLTIRPMTVLNLPLTYPGMSVKIRYGSLTLSTTTVDAKAAPTWATETSSEGKERTSRFFKSKRDSLRPISHAQSVQHNLPENDAYVHLVDDLSIPIDPQKTSGSIRLAVIGERLNTKVELGVLDIPIGAAISCCVESMENALDTENGIYGVSEYVRWFPLINPKGDSIVVEGDMGYSCRPRETEKESDTLFSQYFSPCIKLALLWRPRETDDAIGIDDQEEDLSDDQDLEHAAPLTKTYFNADIARISTALIDSQRGIELIALSASDIDVRYFVSKAKTRIGFVVGWIQIDRQVDGAKEPVVLAPTPVLHPEPTLQFLAYRDNLRSKGKIDSYELIAFYMEELDLTIEESFVLDMWEYFVTIARKREVKNRALDFQSAKILCDKNELLRSMRFTGTDDDSQQSLLELLWQEDNSEAKTYIEKLYLGPVRVNLTYFKAGNRRNNAWDLADAASYLLDGVDADALTAGLRFGAQKSAHNSEIFAKWTEFTHDEDLLTESGEGTNLPSILAAVLPSVSDAPIRLPGKGISFIFENKAEIFDSVKNYYLTETLKQIYKIVGSLDLVGNPTMVLNSFATGFRDFFAAPSKEFLKSPNNPSRVGIGVAKGTLSLFSHSASGIFGFAAKMLATAGQAAAIFTLDKDYQQWHRDVVLAEAKNLDRHWKRRGVGGLSRMFTRPIFDIARGVVLGATGLVVSPIGGARKDGLAGFARGTAVGVVGVLAKPVVGILDAVSHFAGSIHDVAKSVNVLDRRYEPSKRLRLPYTFGVRNVLIPFNPITARSVLLLKKFPISKRLLSQSQENQPVSVTEVHVASEVLAMEPGVETFVIVSTLRIVLVKVKIDSSGTHIPSLCWEIPLKASTKISPRISDQGHNGVALTITACLCYSGAASVDGLPPSASKKSMDITPRNTDVFPDTQEDVRSFPTSSLQVSEIVSRHSQLETVAEIKSSLDGEGSADEVQLSRYDSRTVLAPTGDVMHFFTVLAEFHHRRQLSRLHNAICCMSGNMGAIILDRGLSKDGSSDGYTSFGEFFFTKTEAVHTDNFENRADNLEDVPWVPVNFFQTVARNDGVDSSKEFSKMRRGWKLEKELEASEEVGGPKWLVKARAEAAFVPEQAPEIPQHIRNTYALQAILMKFYDGTISYDEATAEVEQAIELIERMLSEDKAALDEQNDAHTEILSRFDSRRNIISSPMIARGDSLSGQFASAMDAQERSSISSFRSAVGFISPLQLTPSAMDARNNEKFRPAVGISSSLQETDEERRRPDPHMKHDEHLLEDGLAEESLGEKEKPTHSVDRQEDQEGEDTSADWRSSAIALTDGTLHKSNTMESDQTFLSTNSKPAASRQSSALSDPRMDRLELMLEKLLEVSIINAQQQATVVREPSDMATTAVYTELAKLRAEIEDQRKGEDERIAQLRDEVTKLQEQLKNQKSTVPPIDSPLPDMVQRGADDLKKVTKKGTEEFKMGTKTAGIAALKVRKRVSSLFRKSSTGTNVAPPPLLDDENISALMAEEDLIDLESLELDQEGTAARIISKPRFGHHVSDLTTPDVSNVDC